MGAQRGGCRVLRAVDRRQLLRDLLCFLQRGRVRICERFSDEYWRHDTPILWFVNPTYMLPICMLVILWMSLGTGFLSFVAGLQGVDRSQFEAGYMDGVKNRWQELWYITLPNMRPMLMFGAVMSITQAFGVCDVTMALCGYPSTDYAARTIVTHLFDYGFTRFEMGYACAIATILFLMMILCNKAIQSLLRRVGT